MPHVGVGEEDAIWRPQPFLPLWMGAKPVRQQVELVTHIRGDIYQPYPGGRGPGIYDGDGGGVLGEGGGGECGRAPLTPAAHMRQPGILHNA